MTVLIKLFASLRVGRFKAEKLEIPEGTTILELLKLVKLELHDVSIIRVNGKAVSDQYILLDQDQVSIFPPMCGG